jgi:hypothetical protein
VPRDRGIHDEAPVLGVLQEDLVDGGGVPVRPGDGRLEVVDHEPAHDAPEEGPGQLQAGEEGPEVLAETHGQAGVAAVAEGDQEAIDTLLTPGRRLRPQAEDPEVHFGGLPRGRLGHADGELRGPEVAVGLGEAVERAVRDGHPLGSEPAIHLGQPQPLGQPRLDLDAVRIEGLGSVAGRGERGHPDLGDDRRDLRIRRQGATPLEAERFGSPQVFGHRLPVHPRAPGNCPHTVAEGEPAQHFLQFDHVQLAIGHGPSFG